MIKMIIIIFLLLYILNIINSIQIGFINRISVITNSSLISTSNSKCIDCLCNCLNNNKQINLTISKCYDINCFPSNNSCQQIEQSWIQETEISFNSTSDQLYWR
ncbi:unnamed protein product [Rotaria sp. Silwood1]|nr:unnamed protein product [Rotaria sp. Silwood1]CAF3413413.1 unnamed protein product [Rotaria sp. Silwood1]CAF4609391.1 unnamed protein product [Rotaria sp. Silwood1]CAF5114467.1 unnamed protein product [Rotaria sp. Silwood1]